MDEKPTEKIEILWGEAPIVLTRDVVFAAKHLDGLPALAPGSVVLLPADAVLLKPSANKPESEDPDSTVINYGQ